MEHLFSIVTSVYNGEQFIERAIKSVVDQTEKDYEYIIVDNGSTDRTAQILDENKNKYSDIDIKIISVKENRGISGGRNTGIFAATGKYVCFLDADDYWLDNKLSTVKKNMEDHPEISVFCHWELHQSKKEQTIGKYRSVNNINPYTDLLFNGNCLSTSAVSVCREKICEIGGFDEKLVSGEEDYDCWLRLAQIGALFWTIEEPLGVWTIRDDSVSAKLVNHTEAVVGVVQKHLGYCHISTKQQNHIIAVYWVGCGRQLARSKNYKESNKMYKKALKIYPLNVKAIVGQVMNLLHI